MDADAVLRRSTYRTNRVPISEAEVKQAFDRLPAYHPDAVWLAATYPAAYVAWCEELERGERKWTARTPGA